MRAHTLIVLAVLGAMPCIGAEPFPVEPREVIRSSKPTETSEAGQPRAAERWSDELPQFGARWYRITGDDLTGFDSFGRHLKDPTDIGLRPSRTPAQYGVEEAVPDDDVPAQPTRLSDDGRVVIITSCIAFWLLFVACVWRWYAR